MAKEEEHDPLIEWNRLNNEIAEQGFVSSMYQSMAETTTTVDKFSLWLLAGTGATSALLISQVNTVLPHLTAFGFKMCIVILAISAVFGFIAKYKSLRCEIQIRILSRLIELTKPVLAKHEEDKNTIQEYASQKGILLQTDIKLSNIIDEFLKPFPIWVKWLVSRKVKQTEGDQQAGFHIAVKAYISQLRWTFFQAVLFLIFMLTAAWCASAI